MNSFQIEKDQAPLYLNEQLANESNRIRTTLYTFYNFLPLGLWNQLKKFTNIYFLAIACIAIMPGIEAINTSAIFLPISYVIIFSLIFDYYEDFKRFLQDRRTNNKLVNVIRQGKQIRIKSKQVKLGDLLVIDENHRTTADIVLLTYTSPNDYCYIDTSNLDGEKTLKPKISILDKDLSKIFVHDEKVYTQIEKLSIEYRENKEDLHVYSGNIKLDLIVNDKPKVTRVRMDISNFIPRSAKIRNTQYVIGLVVYVGKNTKIMKNMQRRIFKQSSLEWYMQKMILVIMSILMCLLIFLSFYYIGKEISNHYTKNVIKKNVNEAGQFFRVILGYLVLMNTVLPIALIITFQIVKLIQSLNISKKRTYQEDDKKIIINSVNLTDQLGQVQYILSDKTGTLTQNKMVAKYFQVWNQKIPIKQRKIQFKKEDMNKSQGTNLGEEDDDIESKHKDFISKNSEKNMFEVLNIKSKDQKDEIQFLTQNDLNRLFFILLNCCNDCFAKSAMDEIQDQKQNNKIRANLDFEGPSPDEIALLRGSRDHCNIFLKGQNSQMIIIEDDGQTIQIEKFFVFKFDSTRKMMSVIIKYQDKYFLLVKGADNAIADKAINGTTSLLPSYMSECVDFYLEQGLRVMFVAIRLLSKEEFHKFMNDINTFENDSKNTQEEIYQKKSEIEDHLLIIGATAIEDKLQEDLNESLELLKIAGIKIWMITGDKQDTARNIAFASGLFKKNKEPDYLDEGRLYELLYKRTSLDPNIKKIQKKQTFRWRRNQNVKIQIPFNETVPHQGKLLPKVSLMIRKKTQKQSEFHNLLISGKILQEALSSENIDQFTNFIMKYDCVVFSRTNPKQKVQILRLLKEKKIHTLAIGDGANDVNMIQEANVGIGIIGEEGKQAISASDYAIPSFKHLKELLLQDGRISYYNNTLFILLYFYKNFLMTFMQCYFAFATYFTFNNLYSDWYLTCYNLFFTAFFIPSFAITNIDIDLRNANSSNLILFQAYLYYEGIRSKLFNTKKFIFWLLIALAESNFLYYFLYFSGSIRYTYQKQANHQIFSFTLFFIIIICQNIKLLFIIQEYKPLNIAAITLNLGIYIVYIFVTDDMYKYGYSETVSKTLRKSIFWTVQLFMFLSILFFTLIVFTLKRYIYPSPKDYVRNNEYLPMNSKFIHYLEKDRIQETKMGIKYFFRQLI